MKNIPNGGNEEFPQLGKWGISLMGKKGISPMGKLRTSQNFLGSLKFPSNNVRSVCDFLQVCTVGTPAL